MNLGFNILYEQKNITDIKFSTVTIRDLILSLDRLTRFKHPEIKYYRVFSDLISKYLLEPKLSKNEIRNISVSTLKNIIEKIWNESVLKHNPNANSNTLINEVIISDLSNTYVLNSEIAELIKINLNYSDVLNFIDDYDNLPVNLKYLYKLTLGD